MTDEEFMTYRNGRYESAMKYYDDRAITNQRGHRFCSIYTLVVSVALTPILILDPKGAGKIIAAILAPTVAIVTGIASHFQFHENWLSFRATWDALKHELYWRDAQLYEYKEAADRNALFVERVELLISKEGTDWLTRHIQKENVLTSVAKKA